MIAKTPYTKWHRKIQMLYRVREAFVAVIDHAADSQHGFIAIPEGASVTVVGEVQPSGLVNVSYNDSVVAVFQRDLDARADLVETGGP
jgi:hypothetical protein